MNARFTIDHDYHIHTFLSVCSEDEEQLPPALLEDAKARGLKRICVTDHYWDPNVPCNTAVNWWYAQQDHEHICRSLPLPEDDEVQFLFGCEADMDSDNVIGLSPERYGEFGFIIVSTTHFHHTLWGASGELTNRDLAVRWTQRFEAVLNAALPFGKVGVAHLACDLINTKSRKDYLETLRSIPQAEMERLFRQAAEQNLGIELNYGDMSNLHEEAIMRIFRTAKDAGCKFYLGSDAHAREDTRHVNEVFERAITVLDLRESDKFVCSV